MVEITYDRKGHKLTAKGHAKSGEPGNDLVCAATSILVYTLAANVENLADDKSRVRRPVVELKEGHAVVACAPIHGMKAITTLVFDTVCSGFDILAQQYPENVRYVVKG